MNEKARRAFLAIRGTCSHSTPAEDTSDFAFMHRKYGCPDQGAEWPIGAYKIQVEGGEKRSVNKCQACRVEFEPKTPRVDAEKEGRVYHIGCWVKICKALYG